MAVAVSTIILTHDEEQDLAACIESLSWCDDVHVVDSGSADNTIAIARAAGATTHSHSFEGFGAQRNWALENCSPKHDWILFLDADERSTAEFESALNDAITSAPETVAGYFCCWKTMLEGRWIKRCDSFPKWQFRLLRQGRAKFENFGHSQRESAVDGEIDYLRTPYLHFAYSKGWTNWIAKHNRYSTEEAQLRANRSASISELFSPHAAVRLKSLRILAPKLPLWPLLRFMQLYLFRLGFTEGRPGLNYCVNMAYYEFLISLKMRELNKPL